MKPSIGRNVMYCENGQEFAAIITKTYQGATMSVDLTVFPPKNVFIAHSSTYNGEAVPLEFVPPQDTPGATRCWKWPERV